MDKEHRKKLEQQKIQPSLAKAYIESIRQHLAVFKTNPCKLEYEHDFNACPNHHGSDARRNPYQEHTFAYYPTMDLLQEARLNKNQINQTMLCYTQSELLFHPILYKTERCSNFFNCTLNLFCPALHAEDQKYFEYGEFFRFDINTHKTKLCSRRDYHQRKTCVYYHNETDKRRPNFEIYCHELCTKPKCHNNQCQFSHNKIEQVYHPSRYKSKFCKSYTNKNIKCQYKQFCAFAHTQAQIKIQMIHLLNRDYDFFLQKYKTVWCPDTLTHDRSGCVYAHNIQDFRRNPFKYNYQAKKCPFWNFEDELKSIDDSGCKAGMNCDKCHGWMEQRYHPQIFKKNKINEMKQANLMIEKKISNIQKDKEPKLSKISLVVEEKVTQISKTNQQNGIRDVGAPFFKKQAISESSRKTVAMTTNLTTNIQSDESIREETTQQNLINQTQQYGTIRKKSMFLISEDDIWKNSPDDDKNWIQKKLDEERARSQNKFDDCETVYSHSLKQAVGDNSMLRKLKSNNIHEFRLKNLSQNQISQLMFLSKLQKEQLSQKIKIYQLRRQRNPIIYNFQLTKYFIRNKKQHLLQKMKNNKIKQQKLLKMKPKDIQKLEFLTSNEQKELKSMLSQYKKLRNEEEFIHLNEEITRFVSPKRSSHIS